MMYANLIAAAALLAAPLAQAATGKAVVQNQCSFPVYLSSVSNVAGPQVSVGAGKNYSETYRTNPNGGGISIKISDVTNLADGITQFEYTLTDTIWYDISNIDGYPFEKWGVTLIPSVSTCTTKVCPAGITLCADAYNTPDENWATANCAASADLVLVLCSGQSGTVPVAGASSVASAVLAGSSIAPSSAAATPSSTAKVTSTTVKTTGTTFITSSTSAAKLTSSAVVVAATSTNANEVVITTYVTSWTTVDGSAPTATSSTTAAASSTAASRDFGDSGRNRRVGARSEHRRHGHHHARDIVA